MLGFGLILQTLALVLPGAGCHGPPLGDAYPQAASPGLDGVFVQAVGHAALPLDARLSPAQRQYLAMRAAELDALRNLAERIGTLHLQGHSTVSDYALRGEHDRSLVHASLRGARLLSVYQDDRDIYRATVAIRLGPNFFACLRDWRNTCAEVADAPGSTIP